LVRAISRFQIAASFHSLLVLNFWWGIFGHAKFTAPDGWVLVVQSTIASRLIRLLVGLFHVHERVFVWEPWKPFECPEINILEFIIHFHRHDKFVIIGRGIVYLYVVDWQSRLALPVETPYGPQITKHKNLQAKGLQNHTKK
jgi:hypothetical protein